MWLHYQTTILGSWIADRVFLISWDMQRKLFYCAVMHVSQINVVATAQKDPMNKQIFPSKVPGGASVPVIVPGVLQFPRQYLHQFLSQAQGIRSSLKGWIVHKSAPCLTSGANYMFPPTHITMACTTRGTSQTDYRQCKETLHVELRGNYWDFCTIKNYY